MNMNKAAILLLHLNILIFCMLPAFADLIGQVSHERVYHLGVGISGEVRTVPAERGLHVEESSVLLTLQDEYLLAALKAAQSALILAEARLSVANRAHARDEELYDEGSLSLSELEESENIQKQLKHKRDFRAQEVAKREHDIQLSRIHAPESGVILDWSSYKGERVNPEIAPNTQILFGAGDKILEIPLTQTQNQIPTVGAKVNLVDFMGVTKSISVKRLEIRELEGVVQLYVDQPEQLPKFGTYVNLIK